MNPPNLPIESSGQKADKANLVSAVPTRDLPPARPAFTSYASLAAQEKLTVGLGRVLGELASWSVQQSPYDVPDALAQAIVGFKAHWPREEWAEFDTMRDFERAIKSTFDQVPEILAWNERKNGNKSAFAFSTRYSEPSPDDDFIDLDALARNMAMSAWRDAADFKAFNDDFDARHGRPAPPSSGIAIPAASPSSVDGAARGDGVKGPEHG